jgi:uncharacterized glyoxalase superfamily protein PhnB
VTTPTINSITPIFEVTNLDRSIQFYTQVLGFEVGWSSGEPPEIASVCRDSVEIMLKVEAKPRTSHAYLNVTGVDTYFAQATGAGAQVIHPLADRFYGMRDGRIADPDGNHIGLGEPIDSQAAGVRG